MNACTANARSTHIANVASGLAALNPAVAMTSATSPNTPIGANFMIHSVMLIMTWNTPFQKLNSGSANWCARCVMK